MMSVEKRKFKLQNKFLKHILGRAWRSLKFYQKIEIMEHSNIPYPHVHVISTVIVIARIIRILSLLPTLHDDPSCTHHFCTPSNDAILLMIQSITYSLEPHETKQKV